MNMPYRKYTFENTVVNLKNKPIPFHMLLAENYRITEFNYFVWKGNFFLFL